MKVNKAVNVYEKDDIGDELNFLYAIDQIIGLSNLEDSQVMCLLESKIMMLRSKSYLSARLGEVSNGVVG